MYFPDGEIYVYRDGLVGETYSVSFSPYSPGRGHVVIGRRFTGVDGYYGDVELDELMAWNKNLTANQVQDIYYLYD